MGRCEIFKLTVGVRNKSNWKSYLIPVLELLFPLREANCRCFLLTGWLIGWLIASCRDSIPGHKPSFVSDVAHECAMYHAATFVAGMRAGALRQRGFSMFVVVVEHLEEQAHSKGLLKEENIELCLEPNEWTNTQSELADHQWASAVKDGAQHQMGVRTMP
jgi:hypothetical protein